MGLNPQPYPPGPNPPDTYPQPTRSPVRDPQAGDSYVKKLNALLPAELTAAYVALRGIAGGDPDLQKWVFLCALVLCVLFFFFLPKMLQLEGRLPRFLYCLTFLVWIVSLDNQVWAEDVLMLRNTQAVFLYLTSAFAVIWSFSIPYLLNVGSTQN